MKKLLLGILLFFAAASLFSQSAMDYYNMAEEAREKQEYEKSIEYYEKAGELWLEEGKREYYGIMQNQIGYLYFGLGKYDLALKYYERALAIFEELKRKKEFATLLNNIGGVCYNIQNYKQAIDYFSRSIELIEQLRLTAQGDIRRDYLSSQIGTYQFLLSSTIRSGAYDEAFSASEQTKARYLLEKLGERIDLEDLDLKTVVEIQHSLLHDEALLVYANMNWEKPALLFLSRNSILALEFDKSRFIEEIETEYAADIAFTIEATRELQVTGQDEDGEINEGAFEDIIAYYRSLLTKEYPNRTDREKRERIGRELHELLIGPIEPYLDGKAKLLIVPDGVLGFLPFETLIGGSGRYLVEEYSIRYTQSIAVSDLIARRQYRAGKKPLLAFGGAVYEETGGAGRGGTKEGSAGGESEPVVSHKEITYAISRGPEHMGDVYDRMGLRWGNLPGTLEEVREIGGMFPGSSVYTGAEVNEGMVKGLSEKGTFRQYDVLHFSTHGMVVPEYPELSALVLSQVNGERTNGGSGKGAEDGYLCMAEIADLDIEAEFVNLSACETGLGKIYAGEGAVGLTQSFLIAGANGLSVSLWQVADKSTKEFMIGMYRLVKDEGLSYAEAVRQMKLEFLGGAAYGGRYSSPFYWAPFVFYGE